MSHRIVLAVAVLCLLVTGRARATWPDVGLIVLAESTDEIESVRTLPDGTGGLFVVWGENGPGVTLGTQRIKAQRIDADGNLLWGPSGVLIKVPAEELVFVADLAADGAGGFLVAWTEGVPFSNTDPLAYVQRVSGDGELLWLSSGVRPQAGTADQLDVVVTSDGAQGAIVGWMDLRSGARQLYANRISSAGSPLWSITGRRVADTGGTDLQVLPDVGGGASFYWKTTTQLQWQRVEANGDPGFLAPINLVVATRDLLVDPKVVATPTARVVVYQDENFSSSILLRAAAFGTLGQPLWNRTVDVDSAPTATFLQSAVAVDPVTADVVVAWRTDEDDLPRLQRLTDVGTPRYGADGLVLGDDPGFGIGVALDPSGDAVVAWNGADPTVFPENRVLAQRVGLDGRVRWDVGGREVGTAIGERALRTLVPDPVGGAYVAMGENENRLVIQRVEPEHGFWGRPAPSIAATGDVPGDQGGAIEVAWDASPLDTDPGRAVAFYSVWRATDDLLRGARIVDLDAFVRDPDGTVLRRSASGFFWEYVGEQTAVQWPRYSFVVPTRADSTSVDDALTYVQVVAHTVDGGFTFASAPDSARSTDDLAPAAPAALAATRETDGRVRLNWSVPTDDDLRDFRVYRALGDDVAIAPANLFATTADSVLVDVDAVAARDYAYRVVAVDVHENPSPASNLARVTSTATSAPHGSIVSLRLRANHPNPFVGRTQIRFAVARDEPVTILVYDLAGRVVRTIDVRAGEGWNSVVFDGRDDAGVGLASGAYLYRVRTAREERTGRLVLLR